MKVFETAELGNLLLKNRIIRSATYEGAGNDEGIPTNIYKKIYSNLSENDIAAIITGFNFIHKNGRAMQPFQTGIDSDEKIQYFEEIVEKVHSNGCKIFMQIAHTGRQTLKKFSEIVFGVNEKQSEYFGSYPEKLNEFEIEKIIHQFSDAAYRAKIAGFDGVQVHAAHGYLIHQFLLSEINDRKDVYGIDEISGVGKQFLKKVIFEIKKNVGLNIQYL